MVIVDFNGIAVGSVLGQINHGMELNENLVRHIVLNNIRSYRVKYPERDYGRMVIACEGWSWRKDVYPEYKANRTTNRAKDKYDWTEIFRILDVVIKDLRESFPYAVIQIDRAEADDIIGALAVEKSTPLLGEDVVIISADKDFVQLQRHGNVIQYSPLQNKMLTADDPEYFLFEHIMKGDSSDGVPNVMSPDNSFTDKIRQTPMRKKLINEWWQNKHRLKEVMPTEAFRNYMRNREMIDLERTPSNIKVEALESYESYKYPQRSNILSYLVTNNMKLLIENAGEF